MKATTTNNKYLKNLAEALDDYRVNLKAIYANGEYLNEDEEELWAAIETTLKIKKLLEKA